jgi:hypothetical protein
LQKAIPRARADLQPEIALGFPDSRDIIRASIKTHRETASPPDNSAGSKQRLFPIDRAPQFVPIALTA